VWYIYHWTLPFWYRFQTFVYKIWWQVINSTLWCFRFVTWVFLHTYYAINSIFYFHLSNNSCSHSNFMNKQHHNFYLCCDFMNKQHHRFYLCHNFMSKQHHSSYFYHNFMSKFLLVYKFHHNLSTKCLKIDCLLYFLQI